MKIRLEDIPCPECKKRPCFVPVAWEVMYAIKTKRGKKCLPWQEGALCKKCYMKYRKEIEEEYKKLFKFVFGWDSEKKIKIKKTKKVVIKQKLKR